MKVRDLIKFLADQNMDDRVVFYTKNLAVLEDFDAEMIYIAEGRLILRLMEIK